ncbi:MAG: hypothetical protein Q8P31_02920 [Bacillota bacterium]|nr:hypothetical protein [Bacillota bacterium]
MRCREWVSTRRLVGVLALALVTALAVAGIAGCAGRGAKPGTGGAGSGMVVPADAPVRPERGYFLGVLPMPAAGQDPGEAYRQAARHASVLSVED